MLISLNIPNEAHTLHMNKQIQSHTCTVVLVGGCFDVIHYGHTEFLRLAKELGDHLIVALEADENVTRRKGSTRPIHTQRQRAAMLTSLFSVDEVIMLPEMKNDTDYKTLVAELKPNIIAVTEGDPYKHHKEAQAKEIGATVVEIPKIHTPSTSQLAKLIGLE